MTDSESGLKRFDLWLSVLQRAAIISGIVAAAVFFFRNEEGEAHLKIDVAAAAGECHVTTRTLVSNLKGRVAYLQRMRIVIHQDNVAYGIAERNVSLALRIGETTSLADVVRVPSAPADGLAQVRVILWVDGEEEGVRLGETIVEGLINCDERS